MQNKNILKTKPVFYICTFLLLVLITCAPSGRTEASPELDLDSVDDIQENFPRYWNDLARYLAGLNPEEGSVLSTIDRGSLAKKHHTFFDRSWKSESKRLDAMLNWRKQELSDVASLDRNVFYPFSGPDFINIYTLYPNSKRYILFGLENPGSPPDVSRLDQKQQRAFLAHVQKSLASILRWSFFRTLSMRRDFNNKSLDGLNPVLLAFMARKGNRILDLTSVRIAGDSRLYAIYNDNAHPPKVRDLPEYKPQTKSKFKPIPGVRIRFLSPGSKKIQELIFLSFNVSDQGLKTFGQFPDFVSANCPCSTYLKAASYLMHNSSFSIIRKVVLNQSDFLLEDDSGIPIRYFPKSKWDRTFYGRYHTPIPLFKNRVQQDLRKEYRINKVRPLNFGIGYNYIKGTSNLMAARKKK